MENLLVYFIAVLIFIVVFVIPLYFFNRILAKYMTKTETKIGTKNALICGLGLLVMVTAISLIVTHLSGQSFKISFSSSMNIIWLVSLVWMIVYWVRGYSLAGSLLLDCGPHRTSSHFRSVAGLGLVIGLWTFVQSISNGENQGFTQTFNWLAISAYSFGMSCGRLQLRQNGIWQYWGFLRWENIGAYHWDDQSPPTLVVNVKRRSWIPWQGAISVSPDLKQHFDKILREHLPSDH